MEKFKLKSNPLRFGYFYSLTPRFCRNESLNTADEDHDYSIKITNSNYLNCKSHEKVNSAKLLYFF